jgi:drug/metabolite transporter (DMT)-like permease
MAGVKSSSVLAQGSLLIATICYAIAAVLSRRFHDVGSSRVFSAGILIAGAMIATPAIFLTEARMADWSIASLVSVVCLGVFQTGLAGVIFVLIIRRVSASFMSFANYLTPLWAVAMGAAVYGERLAPTVYAALALILAGVFVSRRQA